MIEKGSGQTLLTVKIQLQAGKDHLEVRLTETKHMLDYIQDLDASAKFMSRGFKPDNTPLPPLTSSKCTIWPHNYSTAVGWFQTFMAYILNLPQITEKN